MQQKSGKKLGGQPSRREHHLQQVEILDTVLIHPIEHCIKDFHTQHTQLVNQSEGCLVFDLYPRWLWVPEHYVEEKQCLQCFHLTRASFPASVRAPAQYGTGIAALAVSLVEGQSVPYGRASQLLRDLLSVQLSAGSIASFVATCHQQLAGVETQLKAALIKARVLN